MLKLNGAETNPQEPLSLDNQEDGRPAWVILVALLPVAALLWALCLSVPENVTENPASSLKSLNSLTGFSPRWAPALVVMVVMVVITAAKVVAQALELRLARLLVLSLLTNPTAANTTSASAVDKESWALVVPDFASTSASECATGPKPFNAKKLMLNNFNAKKLLLNLFNAKKLLFKAMNIFCSKPNLFTALPWFSFTS